jgi:predicted dinucleotide-binding enzyme
VVKAFNTVFASRYAAPTENGEPLQVLMAGDDADAKARVADVATSLGFAPVDAGGLRLARALEEMAFLNITLNATNGWAWQSAWQLVGPTA